MDKTTAKILESVYGKYSSMKEYIYPEEMAVRDKKAAEELERHGIVRIVRKFDERLNLTFCRVLPNEL